MGDRSKIEWTDATWNPIRARNKATGGVGHFCEKVSAGCKHCYAERMQPRFNNPIAYGPQSLNEVELYLDEEVLLQPLRWKRPRMIFVGSMTDLFGHWVPFTWLDKLWAVMALCPQHTFQVVTKRPERMAGYLNDRENTGHHRQRVEAQILNVMDAHGLATRYIPWVAERMDALPNVWLLTSIEDQRTADERIPHLLRCTAVVRGLSVEPLLGAVDLTAVRFETLLGTMTGRGFLRYGINWVIVGGESGPKARPMHVEWVRKLRDDCKAAGVEFFFKQWGEWIPGHFGTSPGTKYTAFGHWSQYGFDTSEIAHYHAHIMYRVGKQAAGRLLDGVEHNGMPQKQAAA